MPSGCVGTIPWELDQIGPGSPDSTEFSMNHDFSLCTIRNQGTFPFHVKFGGPLTRATTSDFEMQPDATVTFTFAEKGSLPICSIYFTGSGGTENHYSMWLDTGDSFSRVYTEI